MGNTITSLKTYLIRTSTFWASLLLTTLFCISCTILLTLTEVTNATSAPVRIIGLFVFTVSFIGILISIGKLIIQQFNSSRELSFNWKLTIILHSYFGIITAFAGLYYSFMVIADQNDAYALDSNYYFTKQFSAIAPKDYPISEISSQRAFKGIDYHLWNCCDYPDSQDLKIISTALYDPVVVFKNGFVDGTYSSCPAEIKQALHDTILERNDRFRYRFQSQLVSRAMVDCIYFSVITAATVGYGDITPNCWPAKLATAIEALTGALIFVISLNFLFSPPNRGSGK